MVGTEIEPRCARCGREGQNGTTNLCIRCRTAEREAMLEELAAAGYGRAGNRAVWAALMAAGWRGPQRRRRTVAA